MFCKKISRHIVAYLGVLYFAVFQDSLAHAQERATSDQIDPRLIQIVEQVKLRAVPSLNTERRPSVEKTEMDRYAKRRVQAAKRIHEAAYSRSPEKIRAAINTFEKINERDASPQMGRIINLYNRHADLLDTKANIAVQQSDIANFETRGSWLERYFAIQLSMQLYAGADERQTAFQKAQQAFQLLPDDKTQKTYIQFAKSDTASTLAQLHNMQGNVDFAIANSLEYLNLSKDDADTELAIDIINNLIFSHSLSRDHKALVYLSDQLLEIEKLSTSTVPGLSEFRVAQAANMSGNFNRGLEYSILALGKSQHPQINRFAKTSEAVALAGLGRKTEAIRSASAFHIDLNADHLLKTETRKDVIYLGFLLAQGTDEVLARQLYNRQLDVTAQKFLENSSRDTTAMVADLENSQARQAERDAAAAREAELQAITIDRQRKLNRVLIMLTFLLGGVALSAILFAKYRSRIVGELEIKTIEAASAEKLKTEFLGMISHELRTPLNGIIGISDFLANYHEDPDIREKTGIVLRSGNELLSVVESLTDMARLDAGQLKLVPHDADLSLSLAEVHKPWAEKAADKDLTFTHFIDPSIASYHVDEDRVIQCLNILLANAISFTETGRVHLHITGNKTAQGDVTSLTAVVADTGQGMSELVQSRLFTPFMQADTSRRRTHMGTGLSLAIAYALAEMMGGELSVMSREGRGSEFKFNVPLGVATKFLGRVAVDLTETDSVEIAQNVEAVSETSFMDVPVLDTSDGPNREVFDLMKPSIGRPSIHDVAELVLPTPAEGRQRILVVDDMASNRDVLRLILESQGHICSEAADGFAALTALDQEPFDMVVLDIHMTPLDGVETLRRLRGSGKAYAQIPVVALTADNAASTNAACMEAGADLFLTKPVRQEELLRAISYLLQQAEGARILSQ